MAEVVEALTMACSTIAQFARKFVRVDLHYLDPASGKRVDEVRAGHPRDLGRTPLRQQAASVPIDGSRQSHLGLHLDGRAM
jgi:hypothetical protein